ncbi:MAG TPA: dihydrodipicolinate synthase family protein, partial [Pelagibacteraceae bacterium]|nr:dihydrodipicolinate synthase family protein [Pelagibacteraceae bacterium]
MTKGIYAASLSIFNQDLSLDIDSTINHSENLIQAGCHGCVLLGSTGQAQLISSREKKKLIEKLHNNKFKDYFMIGTGNNALNENIEIMKHSIDNGINRFLLMPPAYYKYDDEGAYSFFANVVQKVPESKIILYNFEKLSGYKFNVQIVEKLAKDFPQQIVGVKDSTYNLYEVLKIPNFLIFPGSETKLLKGLELGNSGIISAICNVTASLARKVYDDFNNKKTQTFNEKLSAIRKVFDNYNLISGLHSFMSLENEKYKRVLPPLSLLSEAQQKEMMSKLKELEF